MPLMAQEHPSPLFLPLLEAISPIPGGFTSVSSLNDVHRDPFASNPATPHPHAHPSCYQVALEREGSAGWRTAVHSGCHPSTAAPGGARSGEISARSTNWPSLKKPWS